MVEMLLTSDALSDVLNQMDTNYFEDILILHQSGKVLTYHGKGETDIDMMTVVCSNMWALYHNMGLLGLKEDPMNVVMLDFANGKIVITVVSEFLICLKSKADVEMGFLYQSLVDLKNYLDKPLTSIVQRSRFIQYDIFRNFHRHY